MDAFNERILGRTGLKVGRMGIAASYGAPAAAYEEAFEKGCNYFYWGSGRHRKGMSRAIQTICRKGMRERLVVALHSYARTGLLTERFLRRRLAALGIEYADVLILGWHNKAPSAKLMDRASAIKEKGLVRFLGMSGHKRGLFPEMAATGKFDVFHIRYNAAHRGAESETFPHLSGDEGPGIVTYTATRWGFLLNPKKMPAGETVPAPSDCYRFVMTHSSVDVCLCGPRDVNQLRAAVRSLELGPLEPEDMARMKRIGDHIHRTSRRF